MSRLFGTVTLAIIVCGSSNAKQNTKPDHWQRVAEEAREAEEASLRARKLMKVEGRLHESGYVDTMGGRPAIIPLHASGYFSNDHNRVVLEDCHLCFAPAPGCELTSGGSLVLQSREGKFADIWIGFHILSSDGGSYSFDAPIDREKRELIQAALASLGGEISEPGRDDFQAALKKAYGMNDDPNPTPVLKALCRAISADLTTARTEKRKDS